MSGYFFFQWEPNDGWTIFKGEDRRECVGGPLDGCLVSELHPATNVAHYYALPNGDFQYLPPIEFVPEPPMTRWERVKFWLMHVPVSFYLMVGALLLTMFA